jgi:hypothetical protein
MRRSGADATREEDVATDKMKRRGVRRNPRGGGGRPGRDNGEGRPPQPARGRRGTPVGRRRRRRAPTARRICADHDPRRRQRCLVRSR